MITAKSGCISIIAIGAKDAKTHTAKVVPRVVVARYAMIGVAAIAAQLVVDAMKHYVRGTATSAVDAESHFAVNV